MKINLLVLFVFVLFWKSFSQDNLSKEIERVKLEIIEYEAKIKNANSRIETLKERMTYEDKEFAQYQRRMDSIIVMDNKSKDSLKNVISQNQSKIDSIDLKLFNLDKVKKLEEKELISFKRILKKECERLIEKLAKMPMVMVKNEMSSLRYLVSSLNSGSTSISEGLSRYLDILVLIENSSQIIEIINGETPEGFALESATFIRVGYCYIAFITESKKTAAIWGYDNTENSRKWITLKNSDEIKALEKTIAIRDGKHAPALGYLPFYDKLINANSKDEEEL